MFIWKVSYIEDPSSSNWLKNWPLRLMILCLSKISIQNATLKTLTRSQQVKTLKFQKMNQIFLVSNFKKSGTQMRTSFKIQDTLICKILAYLKNFGTNREWLYWLTEAIILMTTNQIILVLISDNWSTSTPTACLRQTPIVK